MKVWFPDRRVHYIVLTADLYEVCHQWWFWKDEKGSTVGQFSETENVSSVPLLLFFFQSTACQYVCVCVFFKARRFEWTLHLCSLTLKNCLETPKNKRKQKNSLKSNLFYIYGVNFLKFIREIWKYIQIGQLWSYWLNVALCQGWRLPLSLKKEE